MQLDTSYKYARLLQKQVSDFTIMSKLQQFSSLESNSCLHAYA